MKKFTFISSAFILRATRWLRYWRQLLFLPLIMTAMLMDNAVNAQTPITQKLGNIPVVYPDGGFAVDGDAFANTPVSGIGDWWYGSGTGGSVFTNTGVLITPPANTVVAYFLDEYRGDVDPDITTFASSNKISDNPNTYIIGPGNVPPKDDMQHAVGVFTWGDPSLTTPTYVANGDASDLWCLFAADRWTVNGSSYIDFEFNQAAMILSNGSIISEADELDVDGDLTGGRTPGDVLVTLEFVNGGGVGDVWVDRWEKDGLGQAYYWKPIDLSLPQYANTIFITPNIEPELAPWPIYDQTAPYTYETNQYAEGAINLSNVFGMDICSPLATVWTRTKSSHSTEAELKDLGGLSQVNLDLNPTANAGADGATCYNDGVNSIVLNGSASEGTPPYTYSWSPSTYLNNASLEDPTFSNAPAGTYTLTLTVTDANLCQGTDTVNLVIYGNPTANAGADDATCYDDGVNSIVLNGSATGGTSPYTYSWSPSTYLNNATLEDPTFSNAPAGTYTLTLTVTDEHGCQDTDTVDLVIYGNPICSASNNGPICAGDDVSLSETGGDAVSWLWSSDGAASFNNATLQNPIASGAVDGEIFSVMITDINGCTSTCTTTVTVEPCYEPLCSYTQGYYGNPNGTSCDGENTFSTYGLIEKALDNYPGDVMRIGAIGHSILISKTAADINNVIKFLPGGKGSYELSAGNISISDILFKNWYTTTVGKNNTKINNTLLAQTITLGLNLGMDNDLGAFALQEGTFATADLDGGCGSTIAKERYCDTDTGMVYNEYEYYTIMGNIAAAASNVYELFGLANAALGNADGIVGTEQGISLADIAKAVDNINNAFDGCRMFMGYGVEPLECEIVLTSIIVPEAKAMVVDEEPALFDSSVDFKVYPVPFEDVINVQYRFEYDTDVTIQVFNLQGGLIYGAVDNMYNNGEMATKQINLARTFDQALIIRLTTNKEKLNKNIVAKSSKLR